MLGMASPAGTGSRGCGVDMAFGVAITNARLVAAIAFAATIALAFNRGGYYPTAWGWVALAAAALVCLPLLRTSVAISRLEVVLLAAFVALVGLVALSSFWGTPARGILEAERAAMYALVLGALVAGVRRSSIESLLVGAWAGIAVAAAYGLLTRLIPERFGVFDPVATIRLSEPLGYWNGLGVFAAMGILLAVGVVARGSSTAVRIAAAGSVPVLATTLYFTYSRGAWIALAIGAIAAVAADARRLQMLAAIIPLAAVAGVAPVLAHRSDALNRIGAPLADVATEGRSLGALIVVTVVLCALVGFAIVWVDRRWSPTPIVRRAFTAVLVVVALAALGIVSAREGLPHTLVSRAYHGFAEPPPAVGADISERLFSLSGTGRVPQWRVAWRDFERAPIAGSGAGSYELAWNERRPYLAKIRDAHSIYLETLSELGALGLALLLVVFGAPMLALPRARSTPIASAAFGTYVAFVAHAGVDWDWEMAGVTVVGLTCAAALLVAARGERLVVVAGPRRAVALGAVIALTAFSVVGLIGNRALADADAALRTGDLSRAADRAHDGLRWAPWSATGRRIEAETQLASGELEKARQTFRRAVDADPRNWELWFALAQVTSGPESADALAEAQRLNPLSPELRVYVRSAGGS